MKPELAQLPLIIVTAAEWQALQQNKTPLPTRHLLHMRSVLRKKGELALLLGDGQGQLRPATLLATNQLQFSGPIEQIPARTTPVSIMMPLIKARGLDFMIQKCTELGIDNFYFIQSAFQVVQKDKTDRLLAISENACMQSKNPFLPRIELLNLTVDQLPLLPGRLYLWGDPAGQSFEQTLLQGDSQERQELVFIVGPEGGWSENEKNALKNHFRSIRLSDNVLRAETAAMVACYHLANMRLTGTI